MDSTASVSEIRKITDKVDGWLGKREALYLYALAKADIGSGAIVEIGSWKGKSTIWLARGSAARGGGSVYAIDPHKPLPEENYYEDTEAEFTSNIKNAGVEALVIPLVMSSAEAVKDWQKPIHLLWIDGDHRYEGVHHDFFSWAPHVIQGGVIALHDTYSKDGVRRVVDDEILRLDNFKVLGQVDGILAVAKTQSLSQLDRMNRQIVLTLRKWHNDARVERKHWRALPKKLLRGLSSPSFTN